MLLMLAYSARLRRAPASCARMGRDFALERQILWNIVAVGGFWTLKCEKQVRHCAYDVGVRHARTPYASIICTIGAPFLPL